MKVKFFYKLVVIKLFLFLSLSCQSSKEKEKIVVPIEKKPNELIPPEFPKKTSSWSIKKLLLTKRKSSQEDINLCIKNLEDKVKKNQEINRMIQARDEMIKNLEKNPEVVHWCFFSLLEKLDILLNQDKYSIDQKSDLFSTSMTQLWILARSLDLFYEVEDYFLFLRERYLNISKIIFGRRLKVVLPAADSNLLIEKASLEEESDHTSNKDVPSKNQEKLKNKDQSSIKDKVINNVD